MDTLAFIQSYRAYENSDPAPQLRPLPKLNFKLVSSAWIQLAAATVAISILGFAPEAMAAVRRGDVGTEVRAIQSTLINRGFVTGSVDGIFGPKTEYAVVRFQEENDLDTTGIVDTNTADELGIADYEGGGGGSTPSGNATVATNGAPLNVRSGPGMGYAAIDTVADGTAIATTGRASNGWVQLSGGGWVASNWVAGAGYTGGGSGGGTAADYVRVATNGSALNVRSGPGRGYAVIDVVGNGASVPVTGRASNGWIQLPSGGWISSTWTVGEDFPGSGGSGGGTPRTPANAVTVATNGSPLNVRSGPGTGYAVVDALPNGFSAATTGRMVDGWVQLSSGGWVAGYWVY